MLVDTDRIAAVRRIARGDVKFLDTYVNAASSGAWNKRSKTCRFAVQQEGYSGRTQLLHMVKSKGDVGRSRRTGRELQVHSRVHRRPRRPGSGECACRTLDYLRADQIRRFWRVCILRARVLREPGPRLIKCRNEA